MFSFRKTIACLRLLFSAFLLALAGGQAHAQFTATADFTQLNLGNMEAVPNNSTLTLPSSNSLTVTKSSSTNGGIFTPYYSTDYLAYYSGQMGSSSNALFYNFDNSTFDAGDKVTTEYTFNSSVQQLKFTVHNVDACNNCWTGAAYVSWQDAVEVYYDTGNGTWQNAANTTAFYTVGSTNSRVANAYMTGFLGNNYSAITSTTGDVALNFGNTSVKRVRIVYFSGQSYTGNPAGDYQYIGVSDFKYSVAQQADLSLTMSQSPTTPTYGNTVSYTLNLSAASGSTTATNVKVQDILPTGLTFTGASGYGSYDASTGIWTVPSIAAGQTRTITLSATVTATPGITVNNIAEVFYSPWADSDSIPANGSTTEDDYASRSFTIAGTHSAGTAPTLTCAASTVLDWDSPSVVWTAGSLSGTYNLTGVGNVSFAVSGNTNYFKNDGTMGGQQPAEATDYTGGTFTGQSSLHQLVDYADNSNEIVTTINIQNGAEGAQFRLFDVDDGGTQFKDGITVTGSYAGGNVNPILTNGLANMVQGNTAIGIAPADTNTGDGNVVVTFNQPIDKITIRYSTGSGGPAYPGQQAISLHDINFCQPVLRDWSDAPKSYGLAAHNINNNYYMGDLIDTETAALSGAGAAGDDNDNADDEDGVNMPNFQAGTIVNIPVQVTGKLGYLQGWIDWDGDGSFGSANEQIAVDIQDGGMMDYDGSVNGVILLKAVVPHNAANYTYARFRWSDKSGVGISGLASSGEVEDYEMKISPDGESPKLQGCIGPKVSEHEFKTKFTDGVLATGASTGTFESKFTLNGFNGIDGVSGSNGVEYNLLPAGAGNPDSYVLKHSITPDTGSTVQQVIVCQSPYENASNNEEPNEIIISWPGGTKGTIYDPDNHITSHANGAVIASGEHIIFADSVPNGPGTSGSGLSGPDNWAIIIDANDTQFAFDITLESFGCQITNPTDFCHLRTTGSDNSGERKDEWISVDAILGKATRISVKKTSEIISDPVSVTNPKRIPGAVVRYCILVTNDGPGIATNVSATDTVPSEVTFSGLLYTSTSCAGTLVAEDTDNSGADESDPFGMAYISGVISGTTTSLNAGSSMALIFDATVN